MYSIAPKRDRPFDENMLESMQENPIHNDFRWGIKDARKHERRCAIRPSLGGFDAPWDKESVAKETHGNDEEQAHGDF